MRVLVTGATGFLGNNLIRMLLEDRHEVVAGVRLSYDPRPLDGLNVEVLPIDLHDPSDVARAVADVEVVVHSAAMIHLGWQNLEQSRRVNVETSHNLAVAARRRKVRLIYVSSVDTLPAATADTIVDETQFGQPKLGCSYIITKREAEKVILDEVAAGLDGLIVNPGFLIGPWDWKPSSGKMMLMLQRTPILFFAPRGGCSAVDVRDVADGIVSAIANGRTGERYILAGKNLTYLELWKSMAKVLGKMPPRVRMSNSLAYCVGKFGDGLSWLTRRELQLNSASVSLGQMYNWYSSDKARRELGYRVTDIDVAIQDAWDWFQQFGYVK